MNKHFAGAVLTLGLLITPLTASATSLSSTQIQSIVSLLSSFGVDSATIANVNTVLNGGTPTYSTGKFCHTFTTDLTVGNSGDDVAALNQALTASGIDTTGNSSKFTENSAGDVVSFQKRFGIRQTGYVGPLTRGKLNDLYGCHTGDIEINPTNTYTPPKTSPPPPMPVTPSSIAPAITSITPTEGSANTNVTIYGTNLSGASFAEFYLGGVLKVSFPIISSNGTSVVFTVGSLGMVADGIYQVGVIKKCDGGVCSSNRLDFRVFGSTAAPTIDSFSMNDSQQFSLSARNFSTISLKADCGSFVHLLLLQGTTTGTYIDTYPTGTASLCNTEQYYSNYYKSPDTSYDIGKLELVNQSMYLWRKIDPGYTGGYGLTYIANVPTAHNTGIVTVTVKVCNLAGLCAQKSAPLKIGLSNV